MEPNNNNKKTNFAPCALPRCRSGHRHTPYSSTRLHWLHLSVTSSSHVLAATLGGPNPAPGAKQLLRIIICVVSGSKSCSRPISSWWLIIISPHVRGRSNPCTGSQGRCSHRGRRAFGLGDSPDAGKEGVEGYLGHREDAFCWLFRPQGRFCVSYFLVRRRNITAAQVVRCSLKVSFYQLIMCRHYCCCYWN